MTEVSKDLADRNSGIHRNAANRDITKIFLHTMDSNIRQVVSDFWAKEKHFCKQTGMYSEKYQWNIQDVDKGNSEVWH